MKPPLTYYGGKQKMVPYILPRIPKHSLYVEPFVGGGAVFWNKEPSVGEVINDTNGEIVNFYQTVQTQFSKLKKEIDQTLHSRYLYKKAKLIHEFADLFTSVKRAWATWVLCNMGFSGIMGGSFGYDAIEGKNRTHFKKVNFLKDLAKRMEKVCIEQGDALQVIQSRDRPTTFFYIDPPYYNSNMGHYGGYTKQDFINLLEMLSGLKGKFLLSSYPSEELATYTQKYGWQTFQVKKVISVNKGGNGKMKTEVLTANYPI